MEYSEQSEYAPRQSSLSQENNRSSGIILSSCDAKDLASGTPIFLAIVPQTSWYSMLGSARRNESETLPIISWHFFLCCSSPFIAATKMFASNVRTRLVSVMA